MSKGSDSKAPRLAPPARTGLVAAVLGVCLTLAVATASAQDELPVPLPAEAQDPGSATVDTDYTPAAKPTEIWRQVGGAIYPDEPGREGTELVAGSPTPFDVNLYTVSFRSADRGFAGGSACAETPVRAEGEGAADFGLRVSECERVPVLFRFTDTPVSGEVWEEVYRGEEPGYVGAIAWLDAERAVAVGGTGTYPEREVEYRAGDPAETYETWAARDPAGQGRAWALDPGRFGDSAWHELTAELPPGTLGLAALDFHPGAEEIGAAGALGQIVEWHDGAFTRLIDSQSPTSEIAQPERLRYRVREIRFLPQEIPQAFGVTAGCCAESAVNNHPRFLVYSGKVGSWFVRSSGWQNIDIGTATAPVPLNPGQELPDSFFSLTADKGGGSEYRISVLASPGGPEGELERPSVTSEAHCVADNGSANLLFQPAYYGPVNLAADALRATLASTRLVDGDGDAGKSVAIGNQSPAESERGEVRVSPNTLTGSDPWCNGLRPTRDGVADWQVGQLRSTHRPGLGSRALAVASHLDPALFPEVVRIGWKGTTSVDKMDPSPADLMSGSYDVVSPDAADAYVTARHFFLPSYALHSIDVIGDSGTGWAVGERGAIVRLGESASGLSGGENLEPPTIGARRPAQTADRSPFEGHRPPPAGDPGTVPALVSQPPETLEEPALLPAGSPDPTRGRDELVEDVGTIVTSRDGREAWALGPTLDADVGATNQTAMTTIYHLRNGDWSRCDPIGVPRLLAPDPACESLAGLRSYREKTTGGVNRHVVQITAAARVPLEADSDPSNDDQFEVVAVGTGYEPTPAENPRMLMLRYRDGRWDFEDAEAREAILPLSSTAKPADIVFSAPDEGWLRVSRSPTFLYRWDGEHWSSCGPAAAACDGAEGRGTLVPPSVKGGEGDVVEGLASAGGRVYLYGYRTRAGVDYPVLLHRDRGAGGWAAAGGGLDPGFDAAGSTGALQGRIESLAVAPDRSDGWAVGDFGPQAAADPETVLLRLQAGEWSQFSDAGPIADHMHASPETATNTNLDATRTSDQLQVTIGDGRAFIAQHNRPDDGNFSTGRIFAFDPAGGRWRLLAPGRPRGASVNGGVSGAVQALAADGEGGFWAAVRNENKPAFWRDGDSHVHFFRYTDHPPADVFEEAPHPFAANERVTALAGGADGTVWAGTESDALYRYDRLTGWERVRMPGWDPGRVVTRSSAVHAIALNASGEGIAVGKAGRIAEIEPDRVQVSAAAGTACQPTPEPPCGTARELVAAAVAPDGSALTGGERRTLLWRPAGGEFRAVTAPLAGDSATITGIAMPSPEQAWISTDTGMVFAGELGGGDWSWRLESVDARSEPITVDALGDPIPLRAIAVDASGHGFAVGDRGVVLERSAGAGEPWRRLDTGFLDDLTAVALPVVGGPGALIGGRNDLLLTLAGESFKPARRADFLPGPEWGQNASDPARTKRIVGLALVPGTAPGQVEAWAASKPMRRPAEGYNRLYHYASDPAAPLLDPGRAATPLPDFRPASAGELSFAAFGKSDCGDANCEMEASSDAFEVTARAVVEEIAARAGGPGGPRFAIFTGDAADSAGASTSEDSPVLDRWNELVTAELSEAGVPLFGAIGGQDLSEAEGCAGTACLVHAEAGDNLAWRGAMAGQPAPWGGGDAAAAGELRFEPAEGSDALLPTEAGEGARTHYALDVVEGEERLARIVFADTSLGSLAAGEGLQGPLEPAGGQSAWIERMICIESSGTGTGECTREPDQPAIVVSNTPTYSYGPGALEETQADATAFESLLMRNRASLVVSGRLGWNARYWATAPGVHAPCPGDPYPASEPEPGSRGCGELNGDPAGTAAAAAAAAPSAGDPLGENGLDGLLPFVVAASSGSTLGPDGLDDGEASDGFWHGYSVIHLDRATGQVRVEQRPVFDWIRLSAPAHTVGPNGRLPLSGVGRETIGPSAGNDTGSEDSARYDEIDSAAITHRYDLVLADPDQPWLPCEVSNPACTALHARLEGVGPAASERPDAREPSGSDPPAANPCAPYLCLPSRIGTVDRTTGDVRGGDGRYPETFAVALLSVAEKSASYPLAFEKAPSFVVKAARLSPTAPKHDPSPPSKESGAPAPSPPTDPPLPDIPQIELPAVPVPPAIPLLAASALAEPTPPAPPAPPPPSQQPAPLDLSIAPAGLAVSTPTALIQPPTPPVNPAPPGGARREARQRQAAAQKSGSEADEGSSEGGEVDKADAPFNPTGANMTRHDASFARRARSRPEPSFTAYRPSGNPGLPAGLLYTGGITLLALALAAGWTHARPTPRRREPELPAPAWSHTRARPR